MTTADTQDLVTPTDSRNGEVGRLCVQRLVPRHLDEYRPRKSGFWSSVRDFMQDNNGTVEISIRIGDWMPSVVGSCGPHPDNAAMRSEPVSRFDMIADEMGWDGATRKVEHWLFERVGTTKRLQWLENQVVESLKTESAPLEQMTPQEQNWFLREISVRKKKRAKRREAENRKKQREATI